MLESTRRGFLLGTLAAGTVLYAEPARATLVRGLPLPEMVRRSQRIVVLEPFASSCRYVEIGGRKTIVTDTRVAVHEDLGPGGEGELVLRTLGGRLDGVAELVHGQPVLELGARAVAFLKLGRDGQEWWTTGMAQGHFPLTDATEASRLLANRGLPDIVDLASSAVQRLVGRRLGEARELVHQLRQP
jgi:hypothetical protein